MNGDEDLRRRIVDAAEHRGATTVDWCDANTLDDDGALGRLDIIIDAGLVFHRRLEPGVWKDALSRTFTALRYVYPDWAQESDAERLYYVAVTSMGASMGLVPGEADSQPLGGLWAGLAKTLPQEIPACNVRVVNLAGCRHPGEAVVSEMVRTSLLEVSVGREFRNTILPRESPCTGERVDFTSDDLVVFTGGGRGIGFEIAKDLARHTGCRVVVTGRSTLPARDTFWFGASDEEFEEYCRGEYLSRAMGETPIEIRRRLQAMRNIREVSRNLAAARSAGLRIEYQPCDVSDPSDVNRFFSGLGDNLACVVHNAGVDDPVPLPKKSVAQVHKVVGTKVDGFINVSNAIEDRQLKMLCAVGSLTGRYGGTSGQLDYAAANEALAKLAVWVGSRHSYPVKVLAWPTWQNLGLITNLDAAARYMAPIEVAAGVAAWRKELTTDGSGEIGFMGRIGDVMPQYLKGIPIPSDWSDRSNLLTRRFFLGDVKKHRPSVVLVTEHRLEASWADALSMVEMDGAPVVPLSLILEYVIQGAMLVGHPRDRTIAMRGIQNVAVRPESFRVLDGRIDFHRHMHAEWNDGHFEVHASVSTRDHPAPGEAAEATAVFDMVDADHTADDRTFLNTCTSAAPRSNQRYRPHGVFSDVDDWRFAAQRWKARVARVLPADLFTLTNPPSVRLPLSHLEALIAASPAASDMAAVWRMRRAELDDSAGVASEIALGRGHEEATVLTENEVPLLSLHGLRWELH